MPETENPIVLQSHISDCGIWKLFCIKKIKSKENSYFNYIPDLQIINSTYCTLSSCKCSQPSAVIVTYETETRTTKCQRHYIITIDWHFQSNFGLLSMIKMQLITVKMEDEWCLSIVFWVWSYNSSNTILYWWLLQENAFKIWNSMFQYNSTSCDIRLVLRPVILWFLKQRIWMV